MRRKVTILLTIASAVIIDAQFHAIENDINLQGVVTAALPVTTTPQEQKVRQDDDANNSNDESNESSTNSNADLGNSNKINATEYLDTGNSNGTGNVSINEDDNTNGTGNVNINENDNTNGTYGTEDLDTGNSNETMANENSGHDSNNGNFSSEDSNSSLTSESHSTDINEGGGEISEEDHNDSPGQVDNNKTDTTPEITPSNSIEITEVIVLTEHGEVMGRPYGTAGILSFFDIPYGAFTRAFSTPTKPQPWTTVHDVKEHSKHCPQLDYPNTYVGDTDCLTMSIFTPLEAQNASVLFHIHDGNFVFGSGDPSIYGPDYLVSKGIILVLPNYRLGPLGFLCLQNETARGNAALKDLTLALEWTKNNIQAFGGNPEEITVSGDGTSGALVGYLALSPASRIYFTRAITESGSVLSHWAIDRDPIAAATSLAEILRKNITTELQRNNTFHDIDIETLVKAADNRRFKPCIEIGSNTFMIATPWDVLHEDKVNITFMIGSANHAGMHEAMYHSEESLLEMNKNVEMLLPDDLEFENDELTLATGMRVKKQYFGESALSLTEMEKLSLYYTDASYLGPAIRGARPLANAGTTVYFYEFAFLGDLNREKNSMTGGIQGAARGDIVGYVFTQDRDTPDPDTPEGRMVDMMTDLWASFIKTGKPSAGNIEWNQLKETEDSEEEWLLIESVPLLRRGLHVDRLRLWTEIYKEYFVDQNLAFGLSPSLHYVLAAVVLLFGLRNAY